MLVTIFVMLLKLITPKNTLFFLKNGISFKESCTCFLQDTRGPTRGNSPRLNSEHWRQKNAQYGGRPGGFFIFSLVIYWK